MERYHVHDITDDAFVGCYAPKLALSKRKPLVLVIVCLYPPVHVLRGDRLSEIMQKSQERSKTRPMLLFMPVPKRP